DHGPPVPEDLGADLLRDDRTVCRDRAALRCTYTAFQPQIGRVTGRLAHSAPPEEALLLDEIVQPGLSTLGWGKALTSPAPLSQVWERGERALALSAPLSQVRDRGESADAPVVLQRAEERERSRDVVVGYDQGPTELVVNVVADLAETLLDLRVRPTLERPP